MKPIEYRSDIEFLQALRCVEYRLPRQGDLRKQGYILALGLRYGLVGIAATYHLLETASDDEERLVLASARGWPQIVEDHVRFELKSRIPFPVDLSFPLTVSRMAERPVRIAIPLLQRLCPLESCMHQATEQFISENLFGVRLHWPWFRKGAAVKLFRRHAQESAGFAVRFFQRRQCDLEEVPEIALLGE